jgi:hypothetical protein
MFVEIKFLPFLFFLSFSYIFFSVWRGRFDYFNLAESECRLEHLPSFACHLMKADSLGGNSNLNSTFTQISSLAHQDGGDDTDKRSQDADETQQ